MGSTVSRGTPRGREHGPLPVERALLRHAVRAPRQQQLADVEAPPCSALRLQLRSPLIGGFGSEGGFGGPGWQN